MAAGSASGAEEVGNCSSSTVRALVRSIIGFVISTYALVVTNTVLTALDKAFVGRASSLQLAALGPATAVFDCSSYLLTFLNTATLALLSNQPKAMQGRIRSHALTFATSSGAIQGFLLFLAAAPAVRLLGARGAMLPYSALYLQLRALAAPVDRLASVSTQFWLAEKDGVTPLLATLIAGVANAAGDYLLVPRYGVAGAAVATLAASLISAIFLVARLQTRKVWPRPFQWPRPRDFVPFAAFAGPVFAVLLMRVLIFAFMTAGATALGTAPGAAHQVLVSLFFICGVAPGQPVSWAAQTFLSGAKSPSERRCTLRALALVASACIALSGLCAQVMGGFCLGWFTHDPLVKAEALAAMPVIVVFAMMYVLFLTLEGVAIASQRLRPMFWVTAALAGGGAAIIRILQWRGLLTLTTLWGSQAVLLAGAIAAMGWLTACSLDFANADMGA